MTVSEQTRKDHIRQLLDDLPVDHETLRVKWQGGTRRLPIIRLSIGSTVLNWGSHRIKSQLEASPVVVAAIEADPDGSVAQEAIADLLRATSGFEPLKQNLKSEGQREAGIIDCNGRLINANTRAVALNDIGAKYIDVAVLPSTATLGEIYDVELDLQVAEDYRQPYSFTNELIFVEDLLTEQGRTEEEVGLRLRWITPSKSSTVKDGIAKVRRYVRHLSLLRDIQEMSDKKVALTEFDDSEQSLLEFDNSYESLRDRDPVGAHRLKSARTLGLLVDLGYERQRSVDGNWVEAYLANAIAEDDLLMTVVATTRGPQAEPPEPSPFDDFEDLDKIKSEEPVFAIVNLLIERLSKSSGDAAVLLPTSDGEKSFNRDEVQSAIYSAMRTAAEDAKNAKKAGSDLKAPAYLVEQAAKHLTMARIQLLKVASHPDFDRAIVEQSVQKAIRALDSLQADIGD